MKDREIFLWIISFKAHNILIKCNNSILLRWLTSGSFLLRLIIILTWISIKLTIINNISNRYKTHKFRESYLRGQLPLNPKSQEPKYLSNQLKIRVINWLRTLCKQSLVTILILITLTLTRTNRLQPRIVFRIDWWWTKKKRKRSAL